MTTAAAPRRRGPRASRTPAVKFTAEQEREAFAAWRAGDKRQLDRICRALRPHVVALAKRYAHMGILPAEDLEAEGWIGMLETLQRWDPERGCRILTFAARRMRWHMRIASVRALRLVAIPVSAAGVASVFGGDKQRAKSTPAILAHVGAGPELHSNHHDESESASDVDYILPPDPAPDAETAAITREALDEAVRDAAWALAQLDAREQDILRTGIMADEPERRNVQAKRHNLSRQSVIDIEARALSKMRVLLEGAP